jgi:hypothetical protein
MVDDTKLNFEEEWDVPMLMVPPDLSPGASLPSHEVLPGLWLGDQDSARRAISDGIKSVICCLDTLKEPVPGAYDSAGCAYIVLRGFHDGQMGSIEPFASQGADFIKRMFDEVSLPCLVHCSVGKSRSTTVVIIYMMKYLGFSLKKSMSIVRKVRFRAYPILNFWRQLIASEALILGTNSLDTAAVTAMHSETINAQKAISGGFTYKVEQLVGMGFSEAQSVDSLRENGEDLQAATLALLQ